MRTTLLLGVLCLWAQGASVALPMNFAPQEQTNWCWAAVTQSIQRHYGKSVPQCRLASWFVARRTDDLCCDSRWESTDFCNRPYDPRTSMGAYGLVERKYDYAVRHSDVMDRLKNGHPVVALINVVGMGLHVVIVHGATDKQLLVWDPARLFSGWTDYSAVVRNKRFSWIGTYFVTGTVPKPIR